MSIILKDVISKFNKEEKQCILERALREDGKSHETTSQLIEENFPTEESLNNKLEELVRKGDKPTELRIKYYAAFKKVPNATKLIDEEIIEETKEHFLFSTDIKDQEKQKNKIQNLADDEKEKKRVHSFIEDLMLDRWNLDEASNEYLDLMVKAHFNYLIYDLLFTEEVDLYDSYAQYVKPPAPRFSVVLSETEYRSLELIRVLLTKRENKAVNNTKIMGYLLESYADSLVKSYDNQEISLDLVKSIVEDKTNFYLQKKD